MRAFLEWPSCTTKMMRLPSGVHVGCSACRPSSPSVMAGWGARDQKAEPIEARPSPEGALWLGLLLDVKANRLGVEHQCGVVQVLHPDEPIEPDVAAWRVRVHAVLMTLELLADGVATPGQDVPFVA
jgi:hypothetical protein